MGVPVKHTNENGMVVVEAAFVAILMSILVFGVIQASVFLEHKNDLSDATRAAARTGVVALPTATADYFILQSIRNDKSLMEAGTIERIIIFRADSVDGKPLPSCLNASVSGECNVYSKADLGKTKSQIDAMQTYWPPSARGGNNLTTHYLGVEIRAVHNSIVSLVPFPSKVSDRVVMRVEPESTATGPIAYSATPNPNFTTTTYLMPPPYSGPPCSVDCIPPPPSPGSNS